ncbi:reverse transcriptase/maturase family protein [Prosthecochloris sp.]|uniref:reverse transcriptase/maturase family protein n=1 Tax=Prosthecochloris sp. TaxID=290513 RepID=UPI0025E617CB|nr:reverse transcriptase/maturase family protein [Prosthecochloris sp.]
MKRYGYLWHTVCSLENIEIAHQRARKRKTHYSEVKMVDSDPEKYFRHIRSMLINKTYKCSKYSIMIKKDGLKEREIWKLKYYPDRIIHHCVMNVVEPIWTKGLIRDTYAAVKGRGIHDGVRRLRKALHADRTGTHYCLKMDVRKFYQSILPEVQKQAFRRKLKDPDVLWLLDLIADSAPFVPIGNYPSQPIGNLVLSLMDHWIKENLRVTYYYRYCDDMVILGAEKSELHQIKRNIERYLATLKLELKNNWQVFPVDSRGIDFLGYRFFHGYTLVRKSIVKNFKKKYTKKALNAMPAYHGWFCWANTYNLKKKYNYDRIACNKKQ